MMRIRESISCRVVLHSCAVGIAGVSARRRVIRILAGAVQARTARTREGGGSTERNAQKPTSGSSSRGAGIQCRARGILQPALRVPRVHAICSVTVRMRMAVMTLVSKIGDGSMAGAQRARHADHISCTRREVMIMTIDRLQRQGMIKLKAICRH